MRRSRAQAIRLAVRATGDLTRAQARDAGAAAARDAGLPGAVRARPMDPDRRTDWIIEVPTAMPLGSPEYTSTAWRLAHLLRDSGRFELAEADVPVAAFDPGIGAVGAFADGGCGSDPGSAARDWPLTTIRWAAARSAMAPGAADGAGIRIGHPDSGVSDHFALAAAVDRGADWDLIDDDDDATDPLRPPKRTFFNPLPNPGHGTATASVILGRGEAGFSGVAPGATLVPYRATESVVQVFDSDVADAVRRARAAGCHIVSMSLGGTGFFGLQDAIGEAVAAGMIVMAAAGNQVGVVVAPASYDNCIAVAATGPGDRRWSGSSRGPAVDVAAPGACVWAALRDWDTTPPAAIVDRSSGTSYAVAHLAGCAALWLAHHGRDALTATYGVGSVQAVFLQVLRSPGVCVRPPDWDDDWGVGRVDAAALVTAPLPAPGTFGDTVAFGAAPADGPVERIASVTGAGPERVRGWLTATVGADERDWRRFSGELVHHLLTDPSFLGELVMPGLGTFPEQPVGASPQLRRQATPR